MSGAKTGPKPPTDRTPLALPRRRSRSKSFDDFCKKYIVIRGKQSPQPLKPRHWQLNIVSKLFDGRQPRLAALIMGRGNAKTTTSAAICLWELFAGAFNANVCLVAGDERQAMIAFEICRFMVEHSPQLAARAQIYKDRITVPGRSSTLRVLPAEARRLEGLDYSLCLLDEAQVVLPETFMVLNDAQGKRPESTLLLLGTPGIDPESPLATVRDYARANPTDDLCVLIEHSADPFHSHDVACRHCWALANPSLGDFLAEDGLVNALNVSTEARFRRVRLAQWVTGSGDTYVDHSAWSGCADPNRHILPGSRVILGLDGSRTDDATALVMVSIEARPIVELVGLWEPHREGPDARVPVLAVESSIRACADMYDVVEIAADPFGWSRTLEVLREVGYTVAEFPNTRERVSPVVAAFREAVYLKEISHTGDAKFATHVTNAVVQEWARGIIVSKPSAKSARKIDALMAALFAFSRAKWHAAQQSEDRTLKVIRMGRR